MSKCVSCKGNICKIFEKDKVCYGNDMYCKFRKTPEEIELQKAKQVHRYSELGIRDEEVYAVINNKRIKIHTTVPVMKIGVS
jgi:hypothetical protein